MQLQLDINELLGVQTTLDQAIQASSGVGSSLEELFNNYTQIKDTEKRLSFEFDIKCNM